MERDKTIIIALLIAAAVICCIIAAYAMSNQSTEVLQIDDIDIKQDQFGIYNLEGHITPLKDFDYLDARIVFYDENDTVIGKVACAWNMLNVKKGSSISIGDGLGGVCDGTPSYAVVEFYDSVTSKTPIKNVTVEISGENNTASNDNSAGVSVSSADNSNKNDDKKFTQQDLDRARDEGYSHGYMDSYQDSYSDDDYVEDSSSSQSSGSGSSNVETTTGDFD